MRILRFLRLLPTLIGFALGVMMQVGPDEAEMNLCKWPRKLWPHLPEGCLHGTPTWLLYLISIALGFIGFIWFFWPRIVGIVIETTSTIIVRRKLIPVLLSAVGTAGAILIITAIVGAIAYSRQPSDEAGSPNESKQENVASWSREPSRPQSINQILGTAPFDQATLTPALKEEFYRAIHSVDNLGVNFSRNVSIVAEEGGAPFARALVDLLVAASWTPEDHGGNGEYVGAPNGYRLVPGVTISAPVPSGAAEAIRAAFERIGISTRRKTDRSRTDEYLIIEIGTMR